MTIQDEIRESKQREMAKMSVFHAKYCPRFEATGQFKRIKGWKCTYAIPITVGGQKLYFPVVAS